MKDFNGLLANPQFMMGLGLLANQGRMQGGLLGLNVANQQQLMAQKRAQIDAENAEKQRKEQQIAHLRAGITDPNRQRMFDLYQAGMGDYAKATQPTPQKPTSAMQNYEFAKGQGYGGSFQDWQFGQKRAGATQIVNNAGGTPIPEYNKLPAGYVYKRNPQGQVIIDESGVPAVAPVTGGPAAVEAEEKAQKAQQRQEMNARNSGVVVEDIDRAIGLIENQGVIGGTGISGHLLKDIPSTDAHALSKLLETVKANAGFDRLQQMRDSSPTGGALGQVSERELSYLQAAIGNLDQSQSSEDLIYNLNRVKRIYQDIIHGPSGPSEPSKDQPKTPSVDDLLKKYGG